jgi:hypothetical protein
MSAAEPKKHGVGERKLEAIISDLSKPIPDRLLNEKKVGGQTIVFISWYTAVKFLDLYAPGWSYEIPKIVEAGGKLIVTARINIPHAEGITYREATGQEDEDVKGWGDSSSNAESMALRRAAAKFGLGLSLYERK